LKYLGISIDEFTDNMDRFTNKSLFERNEDTGRLNKDDNGNLVRKFMPE